MAAEFLFANAAMPDVTNEFGVHAGLRVFILQAGSPKQRRSYHGFTHGQPELRTTGARDQDHDSKQNSDGGDHSHWPDSLHAFGYQLAESRNLNFNEMMAPRLPCCG